jgi:hypothetical protein
MEDRSSHDHDLGPLTRERVREREREKEMGSRAIPYEKLPQIYI